MKDISEKYKIIWKDFARSIRDICAQIEYDVVNNERMDLHSTLKALHGIPYVEIREALSVPKVDATSENIGAVTGLFFEQSVVALLLPAVKRLVPRASFERNICSGETCRSLARDPDLYIKVGEREAVVEIKASPKKGELDKVVNMRARYQKQGIEYYFVGGHVSVSAEILAAFAERKWACFMGASARNKSHLEALPKFDSLVQNIGTFLGAA